jgi:hypothetical protein
MSRETDLQKTGKTTALLVGGLVIAVLVFALAKEFSVIDGAIAKRVVGMLFGAILIVAGNFLPKIVQPLNAQPRDMAKTKAVERFAGQTFVVAGIVYIAVWVLARPEHAMLISSAIGLIAFALVGAICVRIAFSTPPGNQPAIGNATGEHAAASRMTFLFIFHALAWVFAMFFVDSLWGDKAAPWMVIGFVMANGLLATGRTISRSNNNRKAGEK